MVRKVFRNLVDQDDARKTFYNHLNLDDFQIEEVSLNNALGRVLAHDVISTINVPPFNRASMDGFAVIASNTISATETQSIDLNVIGEIKAGYAFDGVLQEGQCVEISTGAPMPEGSNAVVMVEYTNRQENSVQIYRSVTPGENTMSAGADIQQGDLIVNQGRLLTSRELATIAAVGLNTVQVISKPKIAVYSSGDEIIPPGTLLRPGKLFDINSTAIMTSLLEQGGNPEFLGIIKDTREEIKEKLLFAKSKFDLVLISGGTSAGMGDMLYEVIDEIGAPGLLVHGVKVKPGKPTILAVCDGTPIVGLPGYPASALSILQLFVIPLVRIMAGLPPIQSGSIIQATITQRFRSAEGRYEFKPVFLFRGLQGWIAYPVPGGSGAITSVALADGFVRIPENTHFIPRDTKVEVHLISDHIIPPKIQIISSHDFVLNKIKQKFEKLYPDKPVRLRSVSAFDSLTAIKQRKAHIGSIHLLDAKSGYNHWAVGHEDITVIEGFYRMQGLIVKAGNPKSIYSLKDLEREDVIFVNRIEGSGSRILLDILLDKIGIDVNQINGYGNEVKSHISAALHVQNTEADVTIGIQPAANSTELDFIELREEEFDLIIPNEFMEDESIKQFVELFQSDYLKNILSDIKGYRLKE